MNKLKWKNLKIVLERRALMPQIHSTSSYKICLENLMIDVAFGTFWKSFLKHYQFVVKYFYYAEN